MPKRILALLLAVALAFVSFGHQAMAPNAPDLTADAMADGTLPQLCLDGSGLPAKADAPCPACVIAAGLHLPDAVVLPPRALAVAKVNWPAASLPHAAGHRPPALLARAPLPCFRIV